MKKTSILFIFIFGLFILAACTIAQDAGIESSDAEMTEMMVEDHEAMPNEATDEGMQDDGEMMSEEESAMDDDGHAVDMAEDEEMMTDTAVLPAWQQIELTDARTGETFTLADFSGQIVFVEPMATWCTNCLRQLSNVREARAQLGEDGAVFIGLSLETNISDAELAQYQGDQGFDWTFAVMTPELLQELADTFGRSITSAPSTPHFIIRPDGSLTDLVTGIESPDQIIQQIQAAS